MKKTFAKSLAAAVLLLVSSISPVWADSVNSPNISLNVDSNRSSATGGGNAAFTINTITIAETTVNEYSSGATKALIFKVRPGFQWDSTSNVTALSSTIGFNGAAVNTAASVTPTGAADETITFNLTSGTSGNQDIIRINGFKIRILNATGAVGPALTTMQVSTSAAGGAFTDQGIVASNIIKGSPDRLVFATQPGDTQSGDDLLPSLNIVDFGGNILTDDRTITLALQNNPGAATLLGTKQKESVDGLAVWAGADDLNIVTAANGYTLRASHNGDDFLSDDTVDSEAFNITSGVPTHMVITQQPVTTAAGENILIKVGVFDASDNPVSTPVDVTLDSAVNPGGWPLLVDTSLTKPTVSGVATWAAADHLRIHSAIENYSLSASGAGAPVQTDDFDITANVPSVLRFVQQPTDTDEDESIDPAVAVEIDDEFGNRTDSAATVQLTFQNAPCGGGLSGASAAAVKGLATFPVLTIDTACDNDILNAAVADLPSLDSDPFDVTGDAPGGGGNAGSGGCSLMPR